MFSAMTRGDPNKLKSVAVTFRHTLATADKYYNLYSSWEQSALGQEYFHEAMGTLEDIIPRQEIDFTMPQLHKALPKIIRWFEMDNSLDARVQSLESILMR